MILQLLAATYGSVEDIEVIFTLIAFGGLLFSLFNLRNAYCDWKLVKEKGNPSGPRAVWGGFSLVSEAFRSTIQAIFTSLGILAMMVATPQLPPGYHLPMSQLLLRIDFRWGLLISALLLLFQSYGVWRTRKRLLEFSEEELDKAVEKSDAVLTIRPEDTVTVMKKNGD
jgi:hypothetical protein